MKETEKEENGLIKKSSEFDNNIVRDIDILDLKDPEKGSIGPWISADIINVVKKFKKITILRTR